MFRVTALEVSIASLAISILTFAMNYTRGSAKVKARLKKWDVLGDSINLTITLSKRGASEIDIVNFGLFGIGQKFTIPVDDIVSGPGELPYRMKQNQDLTWIIDSRRVMVQYLDETLPSNAGVDLRRTLISPLKLYIGRDYPSLVVQLGGDRVIVVVSRFKFLLIFAQVGRRNPEFAALVRQQVVTRRSSWKTGA